MFYRYNIYYDGILIGTVNALSEQSAITKGCKLAKVSASAYGGNAIRLVTAERL